MRDYPLLVDVDCPKFEGDVKVKPAAAIGWDRDKYVLVELDGRREWVKAGYVKLARTGKHLSDYQLCSLPKLRCCDEDAVPVPPSRRQIHREVSADRRRRKSGWTVYVGDSPKGRKFQSIDKAVSALALASNGFMSFHREYKNGLSTGPVAETGGPQGPVLFVDALGKGELSAKQWRRLCRLTQRKTEPQTNFKKARR